MAKKIAVWKDRIITNENILAGKPIINNTRISVEFIMELLAEGWKHEQILSNYPQLKDEDILAALHYAENLVKHEEVLLPSHIASLK